MIEIDKLSDQRPRQGLADRGLARAHHANQKNRAVMGQRTCALGQILGLNRGIRVAGGGWLGRKRFIIHTFIIPLTDQSLKLIGANPRKTFKMIGNEQI
jgi:hypothetical protein